MNVTEDDPPVRFFAVRKYATGAAVESPETQNFTLQAQKSRRNQAGGDDGVNGFTNGGTEKTKTKRRGSDGQGAFRCPPPANGGRQSEYAARGGEHARHRSTACSPPRA